MRTPRKEAKEENERKEREIKKRQEQESKQQQEQALREEAQRAGVNPDPVLSFSIGDQCNFVLAPLSDGRLMGFNFGKISLWNIQTGICDEAFSFFLDPEPMECIKILTVLIDGRLVCANTKGGIYAYNLYSQACDLIIQSPENTDTRLEYRYINYKLRDTYPVFASLPNERLASGDAHGIIKLWNLLSSVCEATLLSEYGVTALTVLLDGRLVSSECNESGSKHDGIIKLWDVGTRLELVQIEASKMQNAEREAASRDDNSFLRKILQTSMEKMIEAVKKEIKRFQDLQLDVHKC